jgi:hypothetical protein
LEIAKEEREKMKRLLEKQGNAKKSDQEHGKNKN